MKVGDYVRTPLGIAKYLGNYDDRDMWFEFDKLDEELWFGDIANVIYINELDEVVLKSSPNIIDLIEVGDYVNGYPVEKVYQPMNEELGKIVRFATDNASGWEYEAEEIYERDIKSIVTKEQLEEMEYKI